MNFLEYTGNYKHPKVNYIFTMKNGKKLKTKYFSKIPNPTFNTSLTLMFAEKKMYSEIFIKFSIISFIKENK